MRSVVQDKFNDGLDLTQSPAIIGPTKCHKAENVVFTNRSVERRLGKAIAYRWARAAGLAVNWLKRFHRMDATGAVSTIFLKTFGDAAGELWKANNDFADTADYAATPITAWTQINLPNTANNSLYGDYSSTTTVATLVEPFASKTWCYYSSRQALTDNTNKTGNCGIRTDGDKAFLMGLVPPADLNIDDTENDAAATSIIWSTDTIETTNIIGQPCIAIDASGDIHIAYAERIVAQDFGIKYAFGSPDSPGGIPTSWTIETAVALTAGPPGSSVNEISLAVDSDGNPHIAWTEFTSLDLQHTYKAKGGVTWTTLDVDTGVNTADPSIAVASDNTVCIAYRDDTNANLKYAWKDPGAATWATPETVDSSASVGVRPSIALDSTDIVHVSYDDTNVPQLSYKQRDIPGTGGVWNIAAGTTGEQIDTVLGFSSIAINSDDDPGVFYGTTAVKYNLRASGSWSTPESVASNVEPAFMGRSLVFDSADTPSGLYNSTGTDTRLGYASGPGGTWSTYYVDLVLSVDQRASLAMQSDYLHAIYTDEASLKYAVGTTRDYFYKLTAEYDDGVLGESRPSNAVGVNTTDPISASFPTSLTLTSGTYDMTDDVTRINVYRTVKDAGETSTYYRVGFVACTLGVPSADFTDNVSDADLVSNEILDEDKYMPPKFRTAVIWKDRAIIANLKCRNTAATEGDLNSLDLGDTVKACVHRNRIRFSDAFHPDIFRAGFFQDILPDGDSGSIRRLIVNPSIDALFVFMDNDVVALLDPVGDLVSTLSFRPKNIANSKGTPAPWSVVEYDGHLFYWTKRGVEVISGFEGRNITSKSIEPLWNMLDSNDPSYADRINMGQLDKVFGHVVKKRERIYWAYPSGTSTYNNRILCFDYGLWRDKGYREGVFSIFAGWDISCMESWDGEGDKGELFGGEANSTDRPWIYRLDYGHVDENGIADTTGTTAAISSKFYPGISPFGSERLKAFKNASVELVTGDTDVTVKLDVDNEKLLATLATVDWDDSNGTKAQRVNFGLPRAANGVRAGLRFEVTDPAGGPSGWKLVDYAMVLDDLKTRMRP